MVCKHFAVQNIVLVNTCIHLTPRNEDESDDDGKERIVKSKVFSVNAIIKAHIKRLAFATFTHNGTDLSSLNYGLIHIIE